MTRTIGLITELELVNSILSVSGDAPVQSLDDEYQPVFIIRKIINNISREMQSRGYWFNSEYSVVLTQNTVTNKITLPFNILRFEPVDTAYVARGLTVYDRVNRTSFITNDVVADLVLHLTFDELPQSAREYIRARGRVQYNNEYFGEDGLKRDLDTELRVSKQELDKEHIENENINIFDSQRVTNIAFQNRRRG